jgi:Acetyltransferase (GNAT) domain
LTEKIELHCGVFAEQILAKSWSSTDQGPADFFLSPTWVDTYARHWPMSDRYGYINDTGVPIAILSKGFRSSRFKKNYLSIGLNVTSSEELRSVTIETNGSIGKDSAHLVSSFPNLLNELAKKDDWKELRIDACLEVEALAIQKHVRDAGYICHVSSEHKTYKTDLNKVRSQHSGVFLNSCSANTRSQLRKAERKASLALGKLEIEQSTNEAQALSWLDELAKLHNLKWNKSSKYKEGFAMPTFYAHQRDLVATSFKQDQLQMLRLSAGEKPLAYLYNFLYQGNSLFYMSGVDYAGTEEFKPGLLAHWYAIEKNIAEGNHTYDFLAGTNRYKESLSSNVANRVCLVIRRPGIRFRLEDMVRTARRKWRKNEG